MSEKILQKLNQFPSYQLDPGAQMIQNLKSHKEVDLNEVFEISHILDSSYFNYQVDNNLNFIILGKK